MSSYENNCKISNETIFIGGGVHWHNRHKGLMKHAPMDICGYEIGALLNLY